MPVAPGKTPERQHPRGSEAGSWKYCFLGGISRHSMVTSYVLGARYTAGITESPTICQKWTPLWLWP